MFWRFLFLSGVLALSQSAHASILDLPASEKTYEILDTIFSGNILGIMSAVLNLGCLLFAGIIIGYTALSSVLNTAHEGNVMGKAYSSMWVPLRTVFAIALMLPMADGYSTVQNGVFYIAKAGGGLASTTWNTALDYMGNTGKLYSPPSLRQGTRLASAMLRNAACLEAINREIGDDQAVRRTTENKSNSDNYRLSIRYTGTGDGPAAWVSDAFTAVAAGSWPDTPNLPIDVCGRVDLTLQKPDDDHISSSHKKDYMDKLMIAFVDLEDEMYELARQLVNEPPGIPLSGKELWLAANQYDQTTAAALAYATQKLNQARINDTNWLDDARDLGFVGAGAWYMGCCDGTDNIVR
jgi:conjugal transfer/type IV secretion protein DotA/TraY